jgi:hypothetical protein
MSALSSESLSDLFDFDEDVEFDEEVFEEDDSQHFEEATDHESWLPESDECKDEEGDGLNMKMAITLNLLIFPSSCPLLDFVPSSDEQLDSPALTGYIPIPTFAGEMEHLENVRIGGAGLHLNHLV